MQIIIKGKEEWSRLVKNRHNRAASKEDLKDNDFHSDVSVKRGQKGVKRIINLVFSYGWNPSPGKVYAIEDGKLFLLDGHHRYEAAKDLVACGYLDDYPVWVLQDMSTDINPDTGKYYTLEEAKAKVEYDNIHSPRAHTATDIIEQHASMGENVCQQICNLAKKYNMGTTIVSDVVTGIRGSSKEDNVQRILESEITEEHMEDVEKILGLIMILNESKPEGLGSFSEPHCVYAIEGVYELCKDCGVSDEFCALMKAVIKIRRPNPFLGFFDKKQTSAFVNHLLYIAEGDVRTNAREVNENVDKIRTAFEKNGLTSAITNYHRSAAQGRAGISIESIKKLVKKPVKNVA